MRLNNHNPRQPKVGQQVAVKEKYPAEAVYIGVVIQLLTSQFMYMMPDNTCRFCLFAGDWRITGQVEDERRDEDA